TSVTWLGLAINAVLATGKMLTGWLCYSQAIFADGLHSLSDCVTDVAVLAGIRIADRPADEQHPYGHRRAITLVTAVLGLGLLAAACLIGYRAMRTMAVRTPVPIRVALPLALAIASVLIKELLYRLTARVGRRTGDTSVMANAWHHRTDAFSSIAAAAGLTAVAVGGEKWHFMDHATAIVLASFLILVGVRILRLAAEEIMDRAPDQTMLDEIARAVAATDGVLSFHAIRARSVGDKVEMDVHVQVDPESTVRTGHAIASDVRNAVQQCCPDVVTVIVHIEPTEAD
ncbi:hypothetical protein LCGC14_2662370, partial [marine sediment metagenome]